ALLARLAELQAARLGRADVARETYARALELDADFRPALRFLAEHDRQQGRAAAALDHYAHLMRELPGDDDDAPGGADATGERRSAALAFASMLDDEAAAAARCDHLAEAIAALGEDSELLDALARV